MRGFRAADAYLLALAFVGGFIDATSYLELGKVFTANMTGNTVLLAVAAVRGASAHAAHSAVALGGFCAGVALATPAIKRSTSSWPRRARRALWLEALSLGGLIALWSAAGDRAAGYGLIALGGIAMGLQSATVRSSHIGVNTTYMTSTLQNAVTGAVGWIWWWLRRAAGAAADGSSRTEVQTEGPSLPGSAWLVYGAGALAGAAASQSWHAAAVGVPLAITALIGALASCTFEANANEEGSTR